MRKLLFLFTANAIAINLAFSQGTAINANGLAADSSAMLDVSSTSQGMLVPRMNTAQINAIVSPASGLFVYNTDCSNFVYNAGSALSPNWLRISQSPQAPAQPGSINGSASIYPGQTNIVYSVSPVSGAVNYVWTVPFGTIVSGSGTNSITVNTNCSATTGIISVAAENNCGSGSVSMLPVTVSAALAVNTPDTVFGNTQLGGSPTATGGVSPYSYLWSPSDDISGTAIANPWAYCTGVTTTYKITITDNIGCVAVDSTVVMRNVTANAGSDGSLAYSCNSNASTVIGGSPAASGGLSPYNYNWGPSAYLSASDIANPTASPPYTTAYTLTVYDSKGCSATSSVTLTVTGSTVLTFNPTGTGRNGSYQNWTVPGGVSCIKVEVTGAKGGNGWSNSSGGKGSIMQGSFNVTPGQQMVLLVGQQGDNGIRGGGGGGGSFFTQGNDYSTSAVWIAAGGGGGSSCNYNNDKNAVTSTTANNGYPSGGAGGTAGNGGGAGSYGTAGAGFLTDGNGAYAGLAFRNGGTGGPLGTEGGVGGFGGGGGGYEAGGGGGGYSGGGGGGCCCDGAGGGGGSYNSGSVQYNFPAANNGDGKIVIMY